MNNINREVQLVKNKNKIGEILFFCGIALELLVLITDNFAEFTIPCRGRIVQLSFLFFCCKILCTSYKVSEWLISIILGVIGSISYFTCGDEYVIRAIVLIIASKDIDVVFLLKNILYSVTASSILIILCAIFGITGTISDVRHYGRGTVEARYCLGFNHANNVHDTLWYLIAIYILFRGKKYNLRDVVVLSCINVALFFLTLSRTGVIVTEIIIIGCFIVKNYNETITKILLAIFDTIVLAGLVWLSAFVAEYAVMYSPLEAKLDPYLNGRLEMVSERADIRYWVPFAPERPGAEIDNGFASLAYSYGTVILALLIIGILFTIYRFYISGNIVGLVIVLSGILVVFMESTFVFNVSLMCNLLIILMILANNSKGMDNIMPKGADKQ